MFVDDDRIFYSAPWGSWCDGCGGWIYQGQAMCTVAGTTRALHFHYGCHTDWFERQRREWLEKKAMAAAFARE